MVKPKNNPEPTRPSTTFECKGCYGHVTVRLTTPPVIAWDGCICHDATVESHNARLLAQAENSPVRPPLAVDGEDDAGIPHAPDMVVDDDDLPGDDDHE